MPYAVTHILTALVSAEFIRDYLYKDGIKRYHVLIAGIAGLLPDLDFALFWILKLFFNNNINLNSVHRVYTHTFMIPLFLVLLVLIIKKWRLPLLAIAFGFSVHLVLDAILAGYIYPIYPFSAVGIGWDLIKDEKVMVQVFASIDSILLVLWLLHEEFKHKISSYF
ncbi:metal-dependent hydrolase [Candidatus Woesearchaeota archaeon]|nr:hypothetical protein [uncultured archaeon]MBS3167287.1 metal-dependent hydrolase [Candidatus Woesearchaeota archaeon]